MKQRRRTVSRWSVLSAALILLMSLALPPARAEAEITADQRLAYRMGYYLDCGISPYLAVAYEMKQIDEAVRAGLLTPAQGDVLLAALVPVMRETSRKNAERYAAVAATLTERYKVPEADVANLRKQAVTLRREPEADAAITPARGETTALLVAYLTRASANFALSSAAERRLKRELTGDALWYYDIGSMFPFIAETLRNGLFTSDLQETLRDLIADQPRNVPPQVREPLDAIRAMLDDGRLNWSERQRTIALLNDLHRFLAPDDDPFVTAQHIIPWPAGTVYVPGPWGDGPGVLA